MSLDVCLYGTPEDRECHECGHVRPVSVCVFDANITHNLGRMAAAAGIYMHVWRPEEMGIVTAKQLIAPLKTGIARLREDEGAFRIYDSANGWGLYEDFVPWLERYLEACIEYPDARVEVSR